MPIIFVHGVANRDPNTSRTRVEPFLKRFIAPEISDNPDKVECLFPFWGDIGADLAWGGVSRPRSSIRGMGVETEASDIERAIALASVNQSMEDLPDSSEASPNTGGLAPAGPTTGAASAPPLRLKTLTADELSDMLTTVILNDLKVDESSKNNLEAYEQQKVSAILAADAVAHDPKTFVQLSQCPDTQTEVELLKELVSDRYQQEDPSGLAGMGGNEWVQGLGDRLLEVLSRSVGLPGFVVSRVLTEVRKPLNDFVTVFLGDVFKYLKNRGEVDDKTNTVVVGEIPNRVLTELELAIAIQQQTGEPIIVMSHSMGGQIMYDLVTTFLPRLPQYQNVRIDFWCATASQVGFFEELKLFLASDSKFNQNTGPVPFPDRAYLGYWWNVWDSNDFISYTANGIISDVDDQAYDSGMSIIGAHGGYLERPSFYRQFAEKVRTARQNNWGK